MPYSEAQKKATMKYNSKNYERLNLQLAIGEKEKYKNFAQSKGISLNALIIELLEREIANDNRG